jgi:hypothetical protein
MLQRARSLQGCYRSPALVWTIKDSISSKFGMTTNRERAARVSLHPLYGK